MTDLAYLILLAVVLICWCYSSAALKDQRDQARKDRDGWREFAEQMRAERNAAEEQIVAERRGREWVVGR